MEADLSGTQIGEYVVVAPIGRGGMGMVYEGRQPEIGKRVAIKVLLKAFSHQQDVVERFLSEARAVNAIRHRGIVDIFSFGKLEDDTRYCVMEFLEGLPFDELIRTRAPLTPGDALRWTDEVLDALDAAHKAGVIHRDIKPSNLFLVDTGHGRPYVKLLDFGIAKLSSFKGGQSVGEASAVVGTPDYMAPEQARAKTISGATDLYAVGCVLFELLTRERVFEGMSAVDMMFAHVQKPPRLPSSVERTVPPEVDAFVLKLLAKAPEDRPKSAVAAREELHILLRKLNEAPTLPPPSAYTMRAPTTERVTGTAPVATPTPGWNEDDAGAGRTWVTPSHARKLELPDAATQMASGPIQFHEAPTDGAQPVRVPSVTEPAPPPRKNNAALFGGIGAAVLLVGVGAAMWLNRAPPEPPAPLIGPISPTVSPPAHPEPVEGSVVSAVPKPEPVVEVKPEPVPEVKPAPELKPEPVRTEKPKGPTHELLQDRLKKVTALFAKYEKARGEEDPAMRRLLKDAESNVATAKTPAELRAAAKALDELHAQLK